MHLSKDSVKHRSHRLWSAILTATAFFAAGSLATGCIIVDDNDDAYEDDYYYDSHHNDPVGTSIDTDQTINAEPGEGVGLFVEYAAGGKWRLWTTCDINYSNKVCMFDVFVSVDTSSDLSVVEGEDLEGFDEVAVISSGEAQFHGETASDIDGMTFTTSPGAILRVELQLDGDSVEAARYIYWIGDGVLHEGAPSNPIDFVPTLP